MEASSKKGRKSKLKPRKPKNGGIKSANITDKHVQSTRQQGSHQQQRDRNKMAESQQQHQQTVDKVQLETKPREGLKQQQQQQQLQQQEKQQQQKQQPQNPTKKRRNKKKRSTSSPVPRPAIPPPRIVLSTASPSMSQVSLAKVKSSSWWAKSRRRRNSNINNNSKNISRPGNLLHPRYVPHAKMNRTKVKNEKSAGKMASNSNQKSNGEKKAEREIELDNIEEPNECGGVELPAEEEKPSMTEKSKEPITDKDEPDESPTPVLEEKRKSLPVVSRSMIFWTRRPSKNKKEEKTDKKDIEMSTPPASPTNKTFGRVLSAGSLETGGSSNNLNRRRKSLEGFRKRFSQSALDTVRDFLDEVSDAQKQHQFELERHHPDVFRASAEAASKGWRTLKSLTRPANQDNFCVGGPQATETAWGRRIYDQHELESSYGRTKKSLKVPKVATSKDKRGRLNTRPDLQRKARSRNKTNLDASSGGGVRMIPLTDSNARELGVWDLIFNPDVIPNLKESQCWDPARVERSKKKGKGKDKDKGTIFEEDAMSSLDTLAKFKMRFMLRGATGESLQKKDLQHCLEKTNFTEEQILDWHRRFRHDCPDGRLTRDQMRKLFKQIFPDGDADRFSQAVMRIFDQDGNSYLDFKEFLQAIDIATCQSEESKLEWAFKLFDCDNSGSIELSEMVRIMETLESLEGNNNNVEKKVKKTSLRHNGSGADLQSSDSCFSFSSAPTAEERARDLFQALDRDDDKVLTKEEFVKGYLERNELLSRQDAQEQKRKLDTLILKGDANSVLPVPWSASDPTSTEGHERAKEIIIQAIKKRAGVSCNPEDVSAVSVKLSSESATASVATAFVKFRDFKVREEVYRNRCQAQRNGLSVEEHLTSTRARLLARCRQLCKQGLVEQAFSSRGDVIAVVDRDAVASGENGKVKKRRRKRALSIADLLESADSPDVEGGGSSPLMTLLVVTDAQYESLVKLTKGLGKEVDFCRDQVVDLRERVADEEENLSEDLEGLSVNSQE